MARASRQQAEEHHREIIAAASRLFREQGLKGATVPEVMQAAHLTHGGFYGHFASKDALAAAACEDAFTGLLALIDAAASRHPGDPAAAFADLVAAYLSPSHRDHAGTGCIAAAFAGDISREPPDSPTRQAYTAGITRTLARLSQPDIATSLDPASAFSTLLGALLLSRATAGSALSDRFLEAGRNGLR